MKTKMFKTLAAAVAVCSMLVSSGDKVNAAVGSTGDVSAPAEEGCTVSASVETGWTVTIPKSIVLDVDGENGSAGYEVSVVGKIDSRHSITVEPDSTFSMKQGDETVPATVAQEVTAFSGKNLTMETPSKATGTVNAVGLRAGGYEGNFNFHIAEKTEPVGEQDAYAGAPEAAYQDWDYKLDDANGVITLNHYNGSAKELIVYASYPVNGKNYRTQISSFDGTRHYQLFDSCSTLTSVTFSKSIDTSNVTSMKRMFNSCQNLTSLDLSGFDTSNVTDMSSVFSYCYALQNLDLGGFDTSKVTNMERMFESCWSLKNLDLRSFNTHSVTNAEGMFRDAVNGAPCVHVTTGKWTLDASDVGLGSYHLQYD